MKNVLEYKGYFTKVEYSIEDHVLHGKIEGINDLVNFECENLNDVELRFHEAVEDYLTLCDENGVTPDKPYRGVFNVRLSPELHRRAAMYAASHGQTLNQLVVSAVEKKLEGFMI